MVAHVQSATGGTDNTTFTPSVKFAAPVGIGNTVIAFVGDAQSLIQSVTDDKGNVYTKLSEDAWVNNSVFIYYCIGVTNGPQTIIMNERADGFSPFMIIDEFSGIVAFDATNEQLTSESSATLSTGSVVALSDGELIYTATRSFDSTIQTVNAPFTVTQIDSLNVRATGYYVQPTGTVIEAEWVPTSSGTGLARIAAFNTGGHPASGSVPTSGLICHWSLGDGSGLDLSVSGNDGVFHGGVIPAAGGPMNNAAMFDGATGYVVSTQVVNIPYVSFSVWVKTSSTGVIAGFADGFDSGNTDHVLFVHNDGTASFYIYNGNLSYVFSDVAINDGKWHHLVGTYGSGELNIYIDGVLDNSSAVSGPAQSNYTQPNVFLGGTNSVLGAGWLAGTFADLLIYDRDLTPTEVASIYLAASSLSDIAGTIIKRIQGTVGGTDGEFATVSTSFAAPVSNGSTVFAFVGNGSNIISITDDKGNIYTGLPVDSDTNYNVEVWYCINITNAPQTLTLTTQDNNNFPFMILDEFSAGIVAFDGTNEFLTRPSNAPTLVTGKVTAASNGEFFYSYVWSFNSVPLQLPNAVNAPFLFAQTDGTSNTVATGYYAQPTARAIEAEWLPTSSNTGLARIAAFTTLAVAHPSISGTLSVTEVNDTLAAIGKLTIGGALAVPQAPDTLSAAGNVVAFGVISAGLHIVQAAQGFAAHGTVLVSGALNQIQADQKPGPPPAGMPHSLYSVTAERMPPIADIVGRRTPPANYGTIK